jgi:ankyrin repeat protein
MKIISTFFFTLAVLVAQAQIKMDMQKAMQFDNDGLTLLHRTSNLDTLKYLIEHGADPNARTRVETLTNSYDGSLYNVGGLTPLMICNNYNAAKYLLEHGADPNSKSLTGFQNSVLNYAISRVVYNNDDNDKRKESLTICELILKHGANPNEYVNTGQYLLCSIPETSIGSYDVMKLLLDYGANPNLQGKYGITPLINLTTSISSIFDNEHDCNKNVAYQRIFKLFKLLLEYRADPNIQKDFGNYAMMEILKWHNFQYYNDADTSLLPTLRLFVAYGANPNLVETTFHKSCLSEANKAERQYLKKYAGARRSFDPFYANIAVAAVNSFNQGLNQPNPITEAVQQGGNNQNSSSSNSGTTSATSQQQEQCAKETQLLWEGTLEYKNAKNGVPPTMINGEKAKLKLVQMMLDHCGSLMTPEDRKTDEELVNRLKSEIAGMESQWNNSNKITR